MIHNKRYLFFLIGALLALSLGALSLSACGVGHAAQSKKVIVLGIDGMDPVILARLIQEGKMPNFARLAETGTFMNLGTSIPPQSPVAWSDFITGMDPGDHGIFDFIHRDAKTYFPYLSTSQTTPPSRTISLGDWVFPLSGGETKLLRKGRSFWEILEERGISTTVIKIPSNFPPVECESHSISGMGTPDILGTYGTFSFYTDAPERFDEEVSGGKIYPVTVSGGVVKSQLVGPANTFKKDEPKITIDFTVSIDPVNSAAKITVQDNEILLNVGEYSDWVHVKFVAIPFLQSVSGMCRFYLKEVRPDFGLYVSPVNIDPLKPALPISTPDDYAADVAEEIGCFYTQGMPEDTKAFSADVLGVQDYLGQTKIVLDERLAMYDYALKNFNEGLLFFYFCSLDQNSHMLWWLIDPEHPLYEAELAQKYGHVLYDIYYQMDDVMGKALAKMDADTTLIVMSDHGFAPFYYSFNLGTWLKDNGYVTLTDDSEGEFYSNVNWDRTRAYALGLNGLYINQRGREGRGIVSASEKDALLDEIATKLLEVRDPRNGKQVIKRVYKTKEAYSNPDESIVPDAIIGYDRGYRASWETAIGSFPPELIADNLERWSGDHCIAAEVVPGILVTNKKVRLADPRLRDLTPTILLEFGVTPPKEMTGRPIF